jgi:hypothetical protein
MLLLEVMERRKDEQQQLLDDLKETRHWKLKEEELDRTF